MAIPLVIEIAAIRDCDRIRRNCTQIRPMSQNHRGQFTIWHLIGLTAFVCIATASLIWSTSFIACLWVTSIAILLLLGIARAFALSGRVRQFWSVFVIVLGMYFVFAHTIEPREVRDDHPAVLLSTRALLWLESAAPPDPLKDTNAEQGIPLTDPFGPLSSLTYTGGQTIVDSKDEFAFMLIGQAAVALSLAYCCGRYSLFVSDGKESESHMEDMT